MDAATDERNRSTSQGLRSLADRISDDELGRVIDPPVDGCLSAGADLDDLVSGLDADLVGELIAAERERLVDRSLHRRDHLETLEEAFPAG